MADETRHKKIRGIQKEYKWLYQLLGGIVLLAMGILIGIKIGETQFFDRIPDYQMNLWTEAVGVLASTGITVLILDRWNKRREENLRQEQLRRDLVRDAGSRSNDIAISAIEQLREKRWLEGENGLLKGKNLDDAQLAGAALQGANLEGTSLCDADLRDANLYGANLKDATLHHADMRGANLENAILRADLGYAKLQAAILIRADLRSSNLSRVDLEEADLMDANLEEALLANTNLRGTWMMRAKLNRAHMVSTDLRGSYMEGVETTGVIANRYSAEELLLPDGKSWEDSPSWDRFTDVYHDEFSKTKRDVAKLRTELGFRD